MVNLNLPALPINKWRPLQILPHGLSGFSENYALRERGDGGHSWHLHGERIELEHEGETDAHALRLGHPTITLLKPSYNTDQSALVKIFEENMSSTNTSSVISVDKLSKSFGDFHVLKGISFTVSRGETVAILGRSGTGKSVTLKSIIGLLDPDAGRIEVLGKCFADMPEAERLHHRRNMGYVFQGAALFDSLTVCENVGFTLYQARVPQAEIRDKVMKRLDMVGLGHAIDRYPSELSGGMQKKGLASPAVSSKNLQLFFMMNQQVVLIP